MSRNRNGQMFASDLVASVIVFFFIVNLSLIIWNMAYENKTKFNEVRQLRERVVRTADILVRTPGYPQDWDETSVELAGFVTEDHVLDNEKLRSFNDTSYADQKDAIRSTPNEFYLTVRSDGSIITLSEPSEPDMDLEFGEEQDASTTTAVTSKRSVLLNTSNQLERATLKLVFWR